MTTGIYKITNTVTGDSYIGQSKNIERRFMEHRTPKNIAKDSPLYKAIRKYGLENFKFEIVEKCKSDDLDDKEREYIAKYKPVYNKNLGGKGNCGYIVSQATKDLLRVYGKNQWINKSADEKMAIIRNLSCPKFGHAVSAETRNKLRLANLGKKQNPETIAKRAAKLSISMKGKANRKRKVLVINLSNWDIEIFPMVLTAARYIKTDPTHLVHVLRKEVSVVKNYYVSYLCSVETNSDECNCVGLEMRTNSKCAASFKEEEIVHAARMENLQTQRDRGYIQLAMRSGQFKTINVRDVREGEIVDEDFVSGELKFKKLPDAERANAPVIGFVAYFELLNGFRKMSYWTVAELKAHGMHYSQTYSSRNEYVRKSSKWETNFEAMASKTVLKLLLAKYAPLSVEMQDAVVSDQAVFRKSDSDVNYVDNEQDVATKIEAAEEVKALDLSDTSNWTADDFDNAVLKGLMSKEEAQALKQLHSQQEQQTEMFKQQ